MITNTVKNGILCVLPLTVSVILVTSEKTEAFSGWAAKYAFITEFYAGQK